MAKEGPILLIEDDPDDRDIVRMALEGLGVPNQLIYFDNGEQMIKHLRRTQDRPFMILCNVHLPSMDGIELRNSIEKDPELKDKSIPFIFFTTDDRRKTVKEAFEIPIQGYFCKEDTVEKVQHLLELLIRYWTLCKHP